MEPAYERQENQLHHRHHKIRENAAMEPAYERQENGSQNSSRVTWADGAVCERSPKA
jgi:hypothetical protein